MGSGDMDGINNCNREVQTMQVHKVTASLFQINYVALVSANENRCVALCPNASIAILNMHFAEWLGSAAAECIFT